MRPWARIRQAHFHDYPPAAATFWLAIALAGLVAGGWALVQVAASPASWLLTLLAVAAAAIASSYPVRIPRSKFSLSTADLCTYIALATLGPAAAILTAGADGALGAWRATRRLTSRVATPTAAMAAAGLAGLAHHGSEALLDRWLGPAGAAVGALGVAALVLFIGTTLPLTSMMSLKRGHALSLREWITGYAWVGAMMQVAALSAGLVVLNARLFGAGLVAAAGVLLAASVLMLRISLARQEAEQAAQDAQLDLARREAEVNQQRFTAAFTHAAVGMAIVGEDRRTLQVNLSLAQLLGAAESELVGIEFERWLHADDVPLLERLMRDVADRPEQAFSVQLRCQRRDGQELWVTLHCSRFQDPGATAGTTRADAGANIGTNTHADKRCVIYQLHDITSRHQAEQRLQHIAYHDSLTDLANRACFTERLALAVQRQREEPNARFAVMFLDLDRFKVVNDSLGHQAGNELLCEVAQRLRASVRPRDLVARLGGDEFAVLCEALAEPAHAHQVAERVGAALSQPLSVRGTEFVPGVSIGITLSDLHERSVDDVLRDADLAMYEAKAAGRGRVVVFDSSMHERIADRLALETDLRRAIGEGKLSAAFQPIFELGERRLVGLETLARWEHPSRGAIPPAVFIKLAEESGHIEAVTRWVIDHAVAQLAQWRREQPRHAGLGVNVNISGRDLSDATLVPHVQAVLAKHGLPAALLALEITETTLMGHLDTALVSLQALRRLGVRLSIDDFGTGYSSLAYLSTLPFDSLKIDRSFVSGMASGAQNIEIVRAVLNLGHTLGKVVVAEGIETAEQLQQLQQLGVDCGQGYLLSRPLSASAAREFLMSAAPMREPATA